MIRLVLGQIATVFILATALLSPAIASGLDDAGSALLKGDYGAALSIIRPMANAGDSRAQLALGLMYRNGQGVAQNHVESVKWIRKAAEQGDSEAEYSLGLAFHDGLGMRQDYAEALSWFRLAAAGGNVAALRSVPLKATSS